MFMKSISEIIGSPTKPRALQVPADQSLQNVFWPLTPASSTWHANKCLTFHSFIHSFLPSFIHSFLRYDYNSTAVQQLEERYHVFHERPVERRSRPRSPPFPLPSLSTLFFSSGFACLASGVLTFLGSCVSLLFLRSSDFSFCSVAVRCGGA